MQATPAVSKKEQSNKAGGHAATTGPTGHAAAPQVAQAAAVGPDDVVIMADFAAWRDSLETRGLFKPRPAWQLLWFLSEPIVLVAAACWVMRSTGSTLLGEPWSLLAHLLMHNLGWHPVGHS